MAAAISRIEAREIRKNLALRYNMLYACYEVYTTIHGSGQFRWHKITDEIAEWYKKNFNLTVTKYLQPSINTGGLFEVSYQEPPTPKKEIA